MAAITHRLIRHRPVVHGKQPHPLRLFFSSEPESQSQPSFSSLQNEPSPQNRPPTFRKPYFPSPPPPFSRASLDETLRKLSVNRNRSADGLKPPFAPSLRHIPFPSPRNQYDSESKTTDQLNLNPERESASITAEVRRPIPIPPHTPKAENPADRHAASEERKQKKAAAPIRRKKTLLPKISADPDQAETMSLRSAARLPLFISSMIQHRADLKEKLSLLEQENSQLLVEKASCIQDMSLAKNQIWELKGKLVASSIERDKVEEKLVQREDKIAELGKKVEAMCKEKLDQELDPLKCVNNFSLYSYYLCYFDCIRHLLKAKQPADLLLDVLKDYNTRNPLHSKFSLPVLDLEHKYGMDLSWWSDRDQLEEAEEDDSEHISIKKAD